MADFQTTTLRHPPEVSGGQGEGGHLEELRRDPIGLMWRVRRECGDVGVFRLGSRPVALLTGAEANEAFFRAPDEVLDQAEAYPFMTPIFGKGIVFDAPPEKRRSYLRSEALRDAHMRTHAETVAAEVERMVAGWDEGEFDLLDFFAELTIYTSSACLIGKRFRESLDRRFAQLYHDLERGTDAVAFVDPHAPIESFRRRDEARARLVELVQAIMDRRAASPHQGEPDLLDLVMSLRNHDGSPRYSADEITGLFISMMFGGHHTTSGTAAWALIELLRHPPAMERVLGELEELFAGGVAVGYEALREMPVLEAAIKETLRLHPPIIIVLRVCQQPFEVLGYRLEPGWLVGASPAVSNRLPECFPDPDAFVLDRYLEPRNEDLAHRWAWIPFGAGRHRCAGAAFAMVQLKVILSILLRRFTFEMAQPPETYRNDHSKMVVQLEQPCVVRYRRR